jgi:Transposase DDE domain
MYIETVPNRSSPPAVLLRESYRVGAKVMKRTLLNLSDWPPGLVEGLRTLLKGGVAVGSEALAIHRSLPHGHVAAVLGVLRQIGLDRLLGRPAARLRDLVVALIVSRIIEPASKLATARDLDDATATSSLGQVLGLGSVAEAELYAALDWLGERQPAIEAALARRHLEDGTLVLYDVSSSYLEGRCCELAQIGYSRDGKRGTLQIVYGLLCAADGCPVAIEVFDGNTADPATLTAQVSKLKQRFGLARVVVIGDRGMITSARIREDLVPAGLDWITSLRGPAIRELAEGGALQLSLFDERDMAEIRAPDYPGERLIVCRNPLLAAERARKRQDLLAATERNLVRLQAGFRRRRTKVGIAEIGLAIGAVIDKYKMAKHFQLDITPRGFTFRRDAQAIAAEARLDGLYVIRTSVPAERLDAPAAVRAYKSLAQVERAFRSLKTVDLQIRPIHHWLGPRVRAHVFLCMLAYHVEWHMRARLKPILFDEADPAAAAAARASIVAPAEPSPAATAKRGRKRAADGLPAHSFQSLLRDLATCTLNQATLAIGKAGPAAIVARPTPVQARAFELLAVNPNRTQ